MSEPHLSLLVLGHFQSLYALSLPWVASESPGMAIQYPYCSSTCTYTRFCIFTTAHTLELTSTLLPSLTQTAGPWTNLAGLLNCPTLELSNPELQSSLIPRVPVLHPLHYLRNLFLDHNRIPVYSSLPFSEPTCPLLTVLLSVLSSIPRAISASLLSSL